MTQQWLLAVDCQYDDVNDIAGVAGVLFDQWQASDPVKSYSSRHKGLEPYVSGHFYLRELPCLLPLIQQVMADVTLKTIIVDGFVDLAEQRSGLGRHLYNALNSEVTVMGIAKNYFEGAVAKPVYRGDSARALWVSNTGSDETLCDNVDLMHGKHRIPTLLKTVDRMARQCVK